ncbi:flagellar hook protein FlgE [Modestobacter sp. DSM 44400]|uniref:flagellar hook protein FlgE n=1 Tax=Modestobacter sp. DSM 44400 TaxID=1550230 RepID=UPI0008946C75|nr:flagellar hook protein FlgE [Modestobacter sp. DSM 44400]SDX87653.1 flagellar hook protein FlgE [Modestobacter sp. DSM 44400]
MLRSMYSAIAGLRAHQTKLDVTGNNIANVNTVGYKGSQTVFEDTLSQVLRNGSSPTGETGGTNPAQVGLGVKLAGITTNFGQGAAQNTGRSTDFMINGDGFFVTQSGNQQLYTRAGSFDFDGTGKLVTPDGGVLQGWTANADGVVNTNGPIGPLSVPYGESLAPVATTSAKIAGNLDSEAKVTTPPTAIQAQIEMYDPQGNAQAITYTYTRTATGWDMQVSDDTGPLTLDDGSGVPTTTKSLSFDAQGRFDPPTDATLRFTPRNADWPGPVTLDMTGVTQYGGKTTVTATEQDGAAMGTLQSFALSNDGTITGVYSNGLRQPIGQLALASFSNPGGLAKAGNSSYTTGDNSGLALIGVAGTGGRGSLSAGALEMSNVDLAEEFTNLIVAQRGFQANSRVITTSDQVLQELVNLKQ